jgi:hypothetical protein
LRVGKRSLPKSDEASVHDIQHGGKALAQ